MPSAAKALLCLSLVVTAWPAHAQELSDLPSAATRLLEAWAKGDKAVVMALVTGGEPRLYGSDISEVVKGRAGVERQLEDDQALWRGQAAFGAIANVSSESSGALATLFFDAPFRVGPRSLTVRFATVWRREDGAWKLVQSVNAVPTVGQSARELIGAPR
jgi:hypothetical protein